MAHEIFISYASEDKAIADAVCEAIESQQLKCWYAPRDVEYGKDFEDSIVDAITVSRLMIVILTSHSNASAHVKREIQSACSEEVGVPVLPFRVEDVPMNKGLRYYIGSVHWLDAITPPLEPHLQKLGEHVRVRLASEVDLAQPRDIALEGPGQTTGAHSFREKENTSTMSAVGEVVKKGLLQISPWRLLTVAISVAVVVGALIGFYLYRQMKTASSAGLNTFTFETLKLDPAGKVFSRSSGSTKYFTEDLGNGVTLDMVQIPAGKFLMGSPEIESNDPSERPQHQVKVPEFFIGKFEVTQAQWRAVARLPKVKIDLDPGQSHWKGDSLPVDRVEWVEAEEFCARLSIKSGRTYRLPSEAEWEYACRAGTTTPFAFGETITMDIANYNGTPYGGAPKQEERHSTVAVGSLGVANPFGVYDMHGNVTEWCLDGPHSTYDGAPADGTPWYNTDLLGTKTHIIRGGGLNIASFSRCAHRDELSEGSNSFTIGDYKGFRVVAVGPITVNKAASPDNAGPAFKGFWVTVFYVSPRKADAERISERLRSRGARVDLIERTDDNMAAFGEVYYFDGRAGDAQKIALAVSDIEGLSIDGSAANRNDSQFYIWMNKPR